VDASGSSIRALMQSPALAAPFLVRILSSLVQTNSVNPGTSEQAMVDVITAWLEPTSAELTSVEFSAGRPSLAAVIHGTGEGPTLVLNGHTDTVPIDDRTLWTSDPFGAEVRDGFLYGRGACDMKAGLAIEIAVAHHLTKVMAGQLPGSLVLHFAAGEERGEPGTLSLLEAGFVGDYGITLEPTELRVAVATRGVARYAIQILGKSGHSSRPDSGRNPIWPLRHVLGVLEEYDKEVRTHEHSLLPSASCTPTMIRAGISENTLPDKCEIWLDRRLLPGETSDGEEGVLLDRLEQLKLTDSGFACDLSSVFSAEPAEIDSSSAFVRRILQTSSDVRGTEAEIWGAPYGSDVRNLVNDAHIEAVTFGPGSIERCHCADECVSIQQMVDAATIIAKVVIDTLAGEVHC